MAAEDGRPCFLPLGRPRIVGQPGSWASRGYMRRIRAEGACKAWRTDQVPEDLWRLRCYATANAIGLAWSILHGSALARVHNPACYGPRSRGQARQPAIRLNAIRLSTERGWPLDTAISPTISPGPGTATIRGGLPERIFTYPFLMSNAYSPRSPSRKNVSPPHPVLSRVDICGVEPRRPDRPS